MMRAMAETASLLRAAPDAVVIVDHRGAIVLANARAESMFGYAETELIGQPVELLVPAGQPGGRPGLREAHLERPVVRHADFRTEFVARRRDGGPVPVEATLNPIISDDGILMSIAMRDVSERRRADEATARLAAIVQSSPDAIIGLSRTGSIESWNAGAQRLYGYPAREAVGASVALVVAPDGRENLRQLHLALAGETIRFETVAVRRDGTPFDTDVTMAPIRRAGGDAIVGVSALVKDVSARKRAERELQRLASAAEYGADAVISVDLDARIRHWSPGAERLYGFCAEEAVGHTLCEIETDRGAPEPGSPPDLAAEIAALAAGESTLQFETRRRHRDGHLVDVLMTVTPWREDGRVIGATTVATDISARKHEERARERALRDLEAAQRVARIGSWTWNTATDDVAWSAQMYEITGRDPALGPESPADLLDRVHPDDRARVAEGQARARAGDAGYEIEYDIVTMGGERRTTRATAYEDHSRPGVYMGTLQDVTAQRGAERAIRAAEERFRCAFEEAPIGMAVLSPTGQIEQANTALGVICGRPRSELEGTALSALLHPADVAAGHELVRSLAGGSSDPVGLELRMRPAAGAVVDVSLRGTLLRYADGQAPRLLCQFQDITDGKRHEAQLRFMADHDPLTGLLNRRKLESELEAHVAHGRRYGAEGALMVLDIDRFKTINDSLGHHAGDELIVSIAGALRRRLRESDVVARLGGDEFAVLLPKAGRAEAARVAEDLVGAIRSHVTPLNDGRTRVTTSIGVAMFARREGLSSDATLVEADLAMYDAKQAGGDRMALYGSSERRFSRSTDHARSTAQHD
jgi:diguanylate cyclase (GGDEF)-like protein/PAS domain S-box-containing protein